MLFKRVSLFSCHQSSGRVHSHEEICVYLGFQCCQIYCKFAVELHVGFYVYLPKIKAVLNTSKYVGFYVYLPKVKAVLNTSKYDVRKSVHHHTIQIIQPTRCNSFTSLLLDVYVWLNMFRVSPHPSSGGYNCTRSLWFYRWREAVCQTATSSAPTASLQR